MQMKRAALLGVLGAMACGGAEPPEMGTSEGSSISLTGASATEDTFDDGGLLDVGMDEDTDVDPSGAGDEASSDAGCRAVDLLFVIDNSGSMEDEQANLISSFPGFINAMRGQLSSELGYNVGITTSDLYAGNSACLQEGSLITQTLGVGASNQACDPYASGMRFMTEQDDLASKFGCAAQVLSLIHI